MAESSNLLPPSGKPRLLSEVRRAIRTRQFSGRTEEAYVGWIRRYVLYHGTRHPRELGSEAIGAFLEHLANEHQVSSSTQNQAASALLFLYREVLGQRINLPADVIRPLKPRRLPIVLTRNEVSAILGELSGAKRTVASLLYGSGLRLLEALQLRVKDVDFERHEVTVRSGKGGHDRITVLPAALASELKRQVTWVRAQYESDVKRDGGWVALPSGLAGKFEAAGKEFSWQWVFPATRAREDRDTGRRIRHHLHESAIQRAVTEAVRNAGLESTLKCNNL